jgi:hypothetical protein
LRSWCWWPLKWAEHWIGRQRRGTLSIAMEELGLVEQVILPRFTGRVLIGECAVSVGEQDKSCTMRCAVRWQERATLRSPVELCA